MTTPDQTAATRGDGHRRASVLSTSLAGAALGGSLTWAAVALVGWTNDGALVAAPVRPLAIAIGAVLGLLVGQGAVHTTRPVGFVVLQASRAVVLTITAWALAAFLGQRTGSRELGVVVGYAFVLPFGFLLGLPLTIPIAAIATAALRFAARCPLPGATVIVLLVVGACAVALLRPNLVEAIRGVLSTAPAGRGELRWTVVNRSPHDLVLGVWTREPDGYGGSTLGVPGCRVTTGSDEAGDTWFVSIDREEPLDAEPVPVVEGTDASAARTAWIEVAADGMVTGIVGRDQPPVDATLVDACDPAAIP
ncbi:MAG: hypothetical protein ABIR11_11975 [Candidatus Limnocylindrales bacterium]